MSKTFKVDPESFEHTQKLKRFGNKRKLEARLRIEERRKQRRQEKELYGRYYFTQQDVE